MSFAFTDIDMTPYMDANLIKAPTDYLRLSVTSNPDEEALVRLSSEQIRLRFTPEQARALAAALMQHADRVEVAHG